MVKLSLRQRQALELLATDAILHLRVRQDIGHYCYIRTSKKDDPFRRLQLQTQQSLARNNYIKAIEQDDLGNSDWVITETGRAALFSEERPGTNQK